MMRTFRLFAIAAAVVARKEHPPHAPREKREGIGLLLLLMRSW